MEMTEMSATVKDTFSILEEKVRQELSSSPHDMDHVSRVYRMCLKLAEDEEGINLKVLRTATLLHDIARVREDQDSSGTIDHAVLGASMAEKWLRELDYTGEEIEKVRHCIVSHRFRSEQKPETLEAQILFDADKLDIIGAIGIARSFMIAGQYNERMYSDTPLEDYIEENLVGGRHDGRIKDISLHAPNIEFETKTKRIPERLYTQTGKEIAKERLEFMERFFESLRRDLDTE